MPILDEIEQFFARQPKWQRRAYAALRAGEELTEQLYSELTKECISDAAVAKIEAPNAAPRALQLVTEKEASVVNLVCVENVKHVDSLAPNQSLSFASEGLTVVYGDNGAGKTGYERILRQVCRARGPAPPLRGNVFSEQESDCSAEVRFNYNGVEQSVTVARQVTSDTSLRDFCIFDTGAAVSLVNEENATAFRPFGLDLLDRFTAIADEIKRRIQSELSQTATPFVDPEDFPETTIAGQFVRNLDCVADDKEMKSKLPPFTDAKEARRAELSSILAQAKINDPSKLAQAANAKALRYQQLNKRLASIASSLEREKIGSFIALRSDATEVQKVAEIARTTAFSNERLKGVGEPIWRRLWEAAKQYSDLAGAGEEFGDAKAGDLCVLCAQPLEGPAAKRMQTLESFVKGKLQEQAKSLEKRLCDALDNINALPLQQAVDDALLQELASDDQTLAEEVQSFLISARDLMRELQAHYANGSGVSGDASLTVPKRLPEIVATLRQRALEVQKSATPLALAAQQNELLELDAQAKLVKQEALVKKEIGRFRRRKELEKAKRSTSTRSASELGKELTTKYVSEALCNRFRSELNRLGLDYLKGDLRCAGAHKGKLFHRITLGAKQNVPLREVVSEGEFRCLALSAFLAEVGGTASGILFDDPVSSLDHTWRGRIATRLAEEAKNRQVIVFTHDIVFHFLLREAAESPAIGVPVSERCVERRGKVGAGFCRDEAPWAGMKTKSRIGMLKTNLVRLKKQSEQGDPDYERNVRDWYGRLRETWERAVEECLLKDCVRRFGHSIKTNSLKEALSKIRPDEDWAAINKGMTRASAAIRGHDSAPH